MFVDRVVVSFIAGNGGNGCVSFRREKFIPRGGPDGGDGGRGGHIILFSQSGCESLIDLKYRKLVKADHGVNGKGKKQTGRNGQDVRLPVPAGTVIKTFPDEKTLFDFDRQGLEFLAAKGGRGGRGNTHFKSSINQAPRRFERGEKGEHLKAVLELKLIAFAGLIGLPNAGKSTLISKISGARPKIADYPFTTLTPNLGVVYFQERSLVVADIPGIIAGAHQGAGMGLEFLRHIERTQVLLYLIDGSPGAEIEPIPTLDILRAELGHYQPQLLKRRALVVANKIDLLGSTRRPLDELRRYCRQHRLGYLEISALKEQNLERLKKELFKFHGHA